MLYSPTSRNSNSPFGPYETVFAVRSIVRVPFVMFVWSTAVMFNGSSGSESLVRMTIREAAASSVKLTLSSWASGGSLRPVMFMNTVAVSLAPSSSVKV